MQPETLFLAQYVGIFFISTALVMLVRRKTVTEILHELFNSRFGGYALGIVLMWIALFLLLHHHIWNSALASIVTLFGWLMLVEATLWILLPRRIFQKLYDSIQKPYVFNSIAYIYMIFGIIVTYLSFFHF